MFIPEELSQRRQKDLIRIQSFRLLDDDFMTKCFESNPACIELVLRIILDMPDLTVLDVQTQVFIANLGKRAVRLDVLAVDSEGKKYNIEIQRNDKGADQKRARFHSGMMDAKWTEKGTAFEELPETYTIFITENDVLGDGLPLYHIERCILESKRLFQDEAHIIYVNGAYRDDSPLGLLMHDFSCTNPADMHYDILAEQVKFYKESEKGVAVMCKVIEDVLQEGIDIGVEKGKAQGRAESATEIARQMLRKKMSLKDIAECTRMPLDAIIVLQQTQ